MIELLKPELTWKAAEIQDGDIICFQKTLSPSEYEFNASRFDNINRR